MDHHAASACISCRKLKRRCSRELPDCSLCKKAGRTCEYPVSGRPSEARRDRVATPTATRSRSKSPPFDLDAAASPRIAPLAPTPSSTAPPSAAQDEFPALFFLDFALFQQRRLVVPTPSLELPSWSLEQSSRVFDVDVYFSSVHTFLPIVSKLRLYRDLPSHGHPKADLGLLLLAMQLHTKQSSREEPPNADMYRTAKAACSYLEAGGVFSIRVVQAILLIALYELEHAIFPAAYLTIGHCARLGHAMGLHDRKKAPQMLAAPTTSTEWEERRRVWWAVMMLDRYVNLGSTNRPFACDDARSDELLPVEEKHFDQGELALIQPLAVSTNTTVQASPFARTCQASHILSRVLRHVNDADANDEYRYSEAAQLNRTLLALSNIIANESKELLERTNDSMADLPLFTSTALCHSALLSLYELYCCAETAGPHQISNPLFLEMQKVSMDGLKEISYRVYRFSQRAKAVAELGGMFRMSPLVCDCLYQAGANYAWVASESAKDEDMSKLAGIKSVLEIMGRRWKCAREYLNVLENYTHIAG